MHRPTRAPPRSNISSPINKFRRCGRGMWEPINPSTVLKPSTKIYPPPPSFFSFLRSREEIARERSYDVTFPRFSPRHQAETKIERWMKDDKKEETISLSLFPAFVGRSRAQTRPRKWDSFLPRRTWFSTLGEQCFPSKQASAREREREREKKKVDQWRNAFLISPSTRVYRASPSVSFVATSLSPSVDFLFSFSRVFHRPRNRFFLRVSGWQRRRSEEEAPLSDHTSRLVVKGSPFWKPSLARVFAFYKETREESFHQSHDLRASHVLVAHIYACTRTCAHKSPRSGAARTENVNLPSGRSACAIRADASYRRSPRQTTSSVYFPIVPPGTRRETNLRTGWLI